MTKENARHYARFESPISGFWPDSRDFNEIAGFRARFPGLWLDSRFSGPDKRERGLDEWEWWLGERERRLDEREWRLDERERLLDKREW